MFKRQLVCERAFRHATEERTCNECTCAQHPSTPWPLPLALQHVLELARGFVGKARAQQPRAFRYPGCGDDQTCALLCLRRARELWPH
eukprot:106779-Alexandrium_andersonii.AAC.1